MSFKLERAAEGGAVPAKGKRNTRKGKRGINCMPTTYRWSAALARIFALFSAYFGTLPRFAIIAPPARQDLSAA